MVSFAVFSFGEDGLPRKGLKKRRTQMTKITWCKNHAEIEGAEYDTPEDAMSAVQAATPGNEKPQLKKCECCGADAELTFIDGRPCIRCSRETPCRSVVSDTTGRLEEQIASVVEIWNGFDLAREVRSAALESGEETF